MTILIIGGIARVEEHQRKIEKLAQGYGEINIIRNALSSDTYYIVDEAGRCRVATLRFCELIGGTFSDIEGRNMHELIHHHFEDGREYPIEECDIVLAMETGMLTQSENDVIWKLNGEMLRCAWTSEPFFSNGERFTKITIDSKQ